MRNIGVSLKRSMAFVLAVMLTIMTVPVVGPVDSASACYLVRIEIYPETESILVRESVTYTAEAFDNNGDSMGDVTADTAFSIELGAGGSWSPHNIYNSENTGTWVVMGEYQDKFDTAILIVNPSADLAIEKGDDPDPVYAGEDLTYTVTVTNNGPSDATGVVVTDTLPAGVTYKSATGGANHTAGVVTWNVGSLAVDASDTITIMVIVDSETRGTLSNTATVDCNETDPYTGNNTATKDTSVSAEADLSIEKTDAPDPVLAGKDLTYTITLTNNGPNIATGVVVTDTLPAGVTFKLATGGATHVGGVVTWDVGNLADGASTELTIVVIVDPEITQLTIENTATVSGNEFDPDEVNNNATEETTIAVVEYIVVSLDPALIMAGNSTTCSAEAFDSGDNSLGDVTAATSFSIIEPGDHGSWDANEYTSEKSGTWTVNGTYDVLSDTAILIVKSGPHHGFVFDNISSLQMMGVLFSISITAVDAFDNKVPSYVGTADLSDLSGTVTPATTTHFSAGAWTGNVYIGTAYMDDTITATDSVNTDITGTSNQFDVEAEEPSIDIEKHTNGYDADAPTGPELNVGDPVQWSYTVTNTGNVALFNITVTDDIGFTVPFPVDTLQPGESETAQVDGTVQFGQYTNVGRVTANSPLGTEVSDSDPSHYLGVPSSPAVSLDLTPDGGTRAIGTPFTVTVTAYDSEGRVATGYTGIVHFDSSVGGTGLPTDYTFTVADVGVHTFTGGVTLNAVGDHAITVTDTVDSLLTDEEVFEGFDPDAVEYIVISPKSNTIIPGQSQAYTVEAYNQFDELIGDVSLEAGYEILEAGAGGSWAVNIYTSQNTGTWTIKATCQGKEDTAELTVNLEPVEYIVISPSIAAITAGDEQTYTAEAFDSGDNSLGDVTATTSFSIIEPGAQGSWDANEYTSEKSGTWTVNGTYDVLSDTAILIVKSGPHSAFIFDTISSPQAANAAFTITITAVDQYENLDSTYTGTASLTDLSGTITPVTTTGGFVSGVWMGNVTISITQVDDVITATDGDITGDSNPFDVETGGTVTGFVYNDIDRDGIYDVGDESGIAEVTVELIRGAVTRTTLTAGDGSYSFEDIGPGVYRVVETDLSGYWSTTSNDVHVDIAMGGNYPVNFGDAWVESEPGAVYGTVFNDVDGDGVRGDDELGIPGVTVTLNGETNTTTDEYGRYTFRMEASGVHKVVETDLDGYFSTTPNEVHTYVSTYGSREVDFGDALGESEFAAIYGTIFEDTSGDGVWDDDEVGISGVTVTLDEETTATTDEYGRYTFRVDTAGVHKVVETDLDGYFSTTPNEVHVDVVIGESDEVNFGDVIEETDFATIHGTVFDDLDGDGIWDDGEVGIPGVTITLDDEITTTTNVYGQYTFTIWTEDDHPVVETEPSGYRSTTPNEVSVSVTLNNGYVANFGDEVYSPPPPPTPRLDHIVVSPDTASITAGGTQSYTAEAFNQFGNSMGDVTLKTTFSIEAGAGGTWVDNTYTSENVGEWTVTGTYNNKSDTVILTVDADETGRDGEGGDILYFTVNFLGRTTREPLTSDWKLRGTLTALSPDETHMLQLEKGTKVVDSDGELVTSIEITEALAPKLPSNTALLGNAYNFSPSGIVFSIPAGVTLGYDVNELTDNVVSVGMAYHTEELGWTDLEPKGGVVAELGKESAQVEHFTIFAVLAKLGSYSAPSIEQELAVFEVSNLSISPAVSKVWDFPTFVITTGEEAVVAVDVTNIGSESGDYTVILRMDGIIVATKKVSLNPGQTEEVSFTVGPNEPGTYRVEIADLSGELESSVWINWGLILGLPAGLILLALLIWYLKKRRTASGEEAPA